MRGSFLQLVYHSDGMSRSRGELSLTWTESKEGEAVFVCAQKSIYAVRFLAQRRGQLGMISLDSYLNDVLLSVGTVRRVDRVGEFPPPHVVALFPGYVSAAFDFDTNRVVYQHGQEPDVEPVRDDHGAVVPHALVATFPVSQALNTSVPGLPVARKEKGRVL